MSLHVKLAVLSASWIILCRRDTVFCVS